MQKTAKITSKGQLTLPAKVRMVLGVKQGDEVVFKQTGANEFQVSAAEPKRTLAGMLKSPRRKPVTIEEMDEGIAQYMRAKHGRRK